MTRNLTLIISFLLLLTHWAQGQAKDTLYFSYSDSLVTVDRTCIKQGAIVLVQLEISGLENNFEGAPVFATDTFDIGVTWQPDTTCAFKVKRQSDNEIGFTAMPPVDNTITFRYWLELGERNEIIIDGDLAYHPNRRLTLLQTDCKIKY